MAERDPRTDPQPGDVLRAKPPKGFPADYEMAPVRVHAVIHEEIVVIRIEGEREILWRELWRFKEQMRDADVLHPIAAPPVDRRPEEGA